ncbi:hypothetical protein DPMN_097336 [Dreissena polymorpha]|uniref:Uncharacterized protein n=1 Tax=Dreissena polymorpha TaxID=45954 RepID=A0A9D4LCS8_DREPO|nr:hypothetical protein DPMN_097336 [Dreissena polymorpha]
MTADKPVRDVSSVDMVRTRHEELRAEIDTRQDAFATIINTGEDLVRKEHYARDEVQSCVCLLSSLFLTQ